MAYKVHSVFLSKEKPARGITSCGLWRREWDSNPRNCRSQLFESCTLNHSDISPYKLCFLSFSLPLKTGEKIQDCTTNDSRKVVGNQQLFVLELSEDKSHFESRLFDQLEYCSVNWDIISAKYRKIKVFSPVRLPAPSYP